MCLLKVKCEGKLFADAIGFLQFFSVKLPKSIEVNLLDFQLFTDNATILLDFFCSSIE